ncbi:expressed unknown protein [Seminavis robusta]|uniref:Uncharacterized protein n=1 Tax=Seminavis robusta TaxID=568900 RepID=A0A9N8H5R8_9STRA|nr:expressed unknown protein [Seminavis robusta]|eukprot:Sro29_g019260.1 n/a (265) ;mRNA; f:127161-127955
MKATSSISKTDAFTMALMKAVDLNTLSVAHYLHGDYRSALITMKDTIELLRSKMTGPISCLSGSAHCHQSPKYICRAVKRASLSEEEMNEFGALFPFYVRPFHLLPFHEDCASEEDLEIVFMTVMYNAALFHHSVALQYHQISDPQAALYLPRALQMYENAFKMHENSSWDYASMDSPERNGSEHFLQLLAICNNMAFLYSIDCNFVAVNGFLSLLNDLMEYSEHARARHEGDKMLFDGEDIVFLFTTTLLLHEQQLLTLAPAA